MKTVSLPREVLLSIAGHGIVGCLLFLQAVLIPREPLEIKRAIRVDVVGLPEKMTEMPDKLPPKAEDKPTPAKAEPKLPPKEVAAPPKPVAPTVPSPNAKKADLAKTQNKALERIKAMNALDKIKGEVSKEKSEKAAQTIVIKGNQPADGNSLTGLEKIEYDRYFDELESKVRSAWSLPQWLADAGYKAQVLVLIDERGYVTKKQIRRSSGNEVFDAKVIEAIEASSPLPPPPQRLRGLLATSGVVLNFPE